MYCRVKTISLLILMYILRSFNGPFHFRINDAVHALFRAKCYKTYSVYDILTYTFPSPIHL